MPLLLVRILILTNISIGVAVAAIAWIGLRYVPYADNEAENTNIRRDQARRRLAPWHQKFKRLGLELGLFVANIYLWPYILYFGIRRACGLRYRRAMHLLVLGRIEFVGSLAFCACAILIAVLYIFASAPDEWSLRLAAILGLIALTARLMIWALRPRDLPKAIRQQTMYPYLCLGIIALADFVTLTTFSTALAWHEGERLSLMLLVDQARGLAAFSRVTEFLKHIPTNFASFVVALTSLIYFVTVVGRLSQFKQFKRDADDYAEVITSLAMSGELEEARERFEALDPKIRQDPAMVHLRIFAKVFDHDFSGAFKTLDAYQHYQCTNKPNTWAFRTATVDDVARQLIQLALSYRFSEDVVANLVAYCCQKGLSDGALVSVALEAYEFDDDLCRRLRALLPAEYPITFINLESRTEATSQKELVVKIMTGLGSMSPPSAIADETVRIMMLISAYYAHSGGFESDFVLVRYLLGELVTDLAPGWLLSECYYYLCKFRAIAIDLKEEQLAHELEAQLDRIAHLGSTDELQNAAIDLGFPEPVAPK